MTNQNDIMQDYIATQFAANTYTVRGELLEVGNDCIVIDMMTRRCYDAHGNIGRITVPERLAEMLEMHVEVGNVVGLANGLYDVPAALAQFLMGLSS